MAVDFAFFIFSSSPYEVVYRIPENTMAPIAKSAQNAITRSPTITRSSFTHSVHISPPLETAFAGSPLLAHSCRKVTASVVLKSHSACTKDPETIETKKMEIKRRIRINIIDQ